MREIIFRGKRIDNGEWVEGYFYPSVYMASEGITDVSNIRCFPKGDVYDVIPETVGQFTGLLDKDGKKIFEGDVVDDLYSDYVDSECIVRFCEGRFSPLVQVEEGYNAIDGYYPDRWEIIGNIHETNEGSKTTPP